MAEKFDFSFLLNMVVERAGIFFTNELHMAVHKVHYDLEKTQRLKLRHITTLLAVEGNQKLYLAFSFEKSLIEYALEAYAHDIEVAEDERERYMEETAADMLNIIVGNIAGRLPSQGSSVSLSTPIVVSDAKTTFRSEGMQFLTACLETAHGKLDIYLVSQKNHFQVLGNAQE